MPRHIKKAKGQDDVHEDEVVYNVFDERVVRTLQRKNLLRKRLEAERQLERIDADLAEISMIERK